ncbi:MAG TPA: TIGR03617 family F420-dependent LLM class oxidoreductase [Pseudolysinimonas sp.]|nr:TIGR03617 family F420-dependent LLM class oxidoreductase [Pseudolysinimonas sp.]
MPSPFLIDAGGDVSTTPLDIETAAVGAEAAGYDGMIVAETKHDPFVGLTLAARGTERITLTSGIAVAFARSPMTIAMAANDIQLVSGGRFLLGLGSQVKAHIERRFSMPWSQPAARMAEYVEAVRAIWQAWATGERLTFTGEFYSHTLMSPFFDPGPNPHGNPPIWIAAVGEGMAETAGRVADGVIGHSFTTRRYLDEVTIPAIARGRDAAGRDAASVGLSVPAFVAVGNDQASLDLAIEATRRQVAFYGSTPAYRGVLELHGWGEAAERLHAASTRGQWDEMGRVVTDEMLAEFAVVGSPAEVAAGVRDRFAGRVTRLSFNAPYPVTPEVWSELLGAARA